MMSGGASEAAPGGGTAAAAPELSGVPLSVTDTLPSFSPAIAGLPKARHAREGFAGLGKLRGAHRALWRGGCLSLVV